MSLGEELLNSVSTDVSTVESGNIVIGTDRFITVPESLKKIGVQYDHNIETVTFDCPRYWDGNDLSKMRIYVNYMRSDGIAGAYLCDDAIIDTRDTDIMHFDWTISGNVTQVNGPLTFLVCIRQIDSEGNETNHWNSELNSDMYVSAGMQCHEPIIYRHADIIAQLLLRMETHEATVTADIDEFKDTVNREVESFETATTKVVSDFTSEVNETLDEALEDISTAKTDIATFKNAVSTEVSTFESAVTAAISEHETSVANTIDAFTSDITENNESFKEELTADNQAFKANIMADGIHYHSNFDVLQGLVATNDQTPTYTVASANSELTSGEKLSVAFGKIAKAIKSLISHLADSVVHITSSERSTWNAKQAAITGGASSITSSNLTANRALVSDGNGKVAVSATTSTQLGYLSTVTSNVQTQLNSKVSNTGGTVNGDLQVNAPTYGGFNVKRNSANDSVVSFNNTSGRLGSIGFAASGKPVVRYGTDANTINEILHTGNATDLLDGNSVGDIITTTRTDLDNTWLLCNGDTISQTEYPKLHSILKSTGVSVLDDANSASVSLIKYYNGTWVMIALKSGVLYSYTATDLLGPWSVTTQSVSFTSSSDALIFIDCYNGTWVIGGQTYVSASSAYCCFFLTATNPAGPWTVHNVGAAINQTYFKYSVVCHNGTLAYVTAASGYLAVRSIQLAKLSSSATWTSVNAARAEEAWSLVYQNGMFVATGKYGSNPVVAYSTSLSGSWTAPTVTTNNFSATSGQLINLVYHKGRWMATCMSNSKLRTYVTSSSIPDFWGGHYIIDAAISASSYAVFCLPDSVNILYAPSDGNGNYGYTRLLTMYDFDGNVVERELDTVGSVSAGIKSACVNGDIWAVATSRNFYNGVGSRACIISNGLKRLPAEADSNAYTYIKAKE